MLLALKGMVKYFKNMSRNRGICKATKSNLTKSFSKQKNFYFTLSILLSTLY